MQNWNFIRLFETTESTSDEDLGLLVKAMKADPENGNGIPAGYTYFGQFLAHDLTELRRGSRDPGRDPVSVKKLKQARKPALDLDSLYGCGLEDSIVTYKKKTGKFVLGKAANGKSRDLFRRPDGTPLIADVRNDENLLVAQMHVLFMRFHNKLIDHYRNQPGGRKLTASELFVRARTEAILSFQWITLYDFARRILPVEIYRHIVLERRGALLPRHRKSPATSIEFSGAAFRLGHSMVRNTYQISSSAPFVNLAELFSYTGKGILSHGVKLPEKMIVDWRLFFTFRDHAQWRDLSGRVANQARRIDTSIASFMQSLPHGCCGGDIIDLHLRRGRELGLATGQEVCKQLQERHPRVAKDVGLEVMTKSTLFDRLPKGSKLRSQTPLWAYILSEAREYIRDNGPDRLACVGRLGGWIVADGLMAAIHYSDVHLDSAWSPRESVINQLLGERKAPESRDSLSLEDLIVFTYSKDLQMPRVQTK